MGVDKKPRSIAIFGAGGFGLEVAMLVKQINAVKNEWELIGFFDDHLTKGKRVNGYPILGGISELNAWPNELYVAFALGIPETRKSVIQKIENQEIKYPTLIHPSAILGEGKYLSIGEGSIICAGNIITANISIGKHVILNLGCTIGHETTIGDFCSFMPLCSISGEVSIGQASYWGTGAKVINRKSIGECTVVGAGAVIITDVPGHATVVGVPAKIVKKL